MKGLPHMLRRPASNIRGWCLLKGNLLIKGNRLWRAFQKGSLRLTSGQRFSHMSLCLTEHFEPTVARLTFVNTPAFFGFPQACV